MNTVGQCQSIVVLGLCYNVEHCIEKTLKRLETMIRPYQNSKIVILESNSTDKSREKLQLWQQQQQSQQPLNLACKQPAVGSSAHERFLLSENKTKVLTGQILFKKQHKFGGIEALRFQKMGILRNTLVAFYREQKKLMSPEFRNNHHVLMMDMDIEGEWNIPRVWELTNVPGTPGTTSMSARAPGSSAQAQLAVANKQWAGIACLGLNIHKKWYPWANECPKQNFILLKPKWEYYDQLAFRNQQGQHKCFKFPDLNPRFGSDGLRNSAVTSTTQSKLDLVPVKSAFGGLCIYKSFVFDTLNYIDDKTAKFCEHVPFHEKLANLGHQLYVDPNLVLFYKEYSLKLNPGTCMSDNLESKLFQGQDMKTKQDFINLCNKKLTKLK